MIEGLIASLTPERQILLYSSHYTCAPAAPWFDWHVLHRNLLAELITCAQADKLLSPEFQPVIEGLIASLPPERQILLYSATFPVTVKEFKDRYLKKPFIINLMQELTLRGITQARLLSCGGLFWDLTVTAACCCCQAFCW